MRNRGPKRQWWGLSWGQRREVLQFARHMQVHPDPAIRDAAYRWALEVRSQSVWRTAVEGMFDNGMSWAERRSARSIRRVETAARADDLLTSEGPDVRR